uniref:glutathione transferase n=1 Tax=Plectus sambesii TaxID=2011161 RepID=A0A914X7W4_9BILA
MPQTPHYKLTYFNIYGLAEPIRLIFAQADVKYEDERLDDAAWQKRKQLTPNGQLPLLEVDGKVLPQSKAISTYLAKQFGLNGQDDWEAAQIQAAIAGLDDVKTQARTYREENIPKKAELFQKLEHDVLLPYLNRLEKALAENGTGYFVGSHVTQADLHLFDYLKRFNDSGLISPALKKMPNLAKFIDTIGNLPKIKEWIEHRPKTH